MKDDILELKPIKENISYYDIIEKKIKELFKKELYYPLLQVLNLKVNILKNSKPTALQQAIQYDKVFYSGDEFSGKFNAAISKELRSYGAIWDRKSSTYKIKLSKLPFEIRNVISTSKVRFDDKLTEIDKKLSQMVPGEIGKQLHITPQFDRTLWEVEKEFQKSVEKITVVPKLSDQERKKIADEWQNNMQLYIKSFTEEEIVNLRQKVNENVFTGNRRENLIKTFMDSYNVSQNKAKFWARQETNLLMAKYKETKYMDADVPMYKWACVKMPHQPSPIAPYKPGEVRYDHGILEGKYFNWNDPYEVDANGNRKTDSLIKPQNGKCNPGTDYNCRCFAIPVVRFKR